MLGLRELHASRRIIDCSQPGTRDLEGAVAPLPCLNMEGVVGEEHPSIAGHEVDCIKHVIDGSLIPDIAEIESGVANTELL